LPTGGAASIANEKLKEAHVAEHAEKGTQQAKEYTAKSWNFMKGVYANVASQVESVARENGYKVDLGEHCIAVMQSGYTLVWTPKYVSSVLQPERQQQTQRCNAPLLNKRQKFESEFRFFQGIANQKEKKRQDFVFWR